MNTSSTARPPRRELAPRVKRVVEELTRRINQGRLQPGDQLPALRQLGQAMGVSNGVIHSAFRHLESLGLVETVHGSGTYVRQRSQGGVPRRHGNEVYILLHNRRHGFNAPLDALTDALQDRGFMPIALAFDRFEPGRVEQLLTLWHASPPRAVLVRGASRQVAETVQKHSPAITRFIMIYGLLDGTSPHWHCVRPDEFLSYHLAAKHLLDKGHRRIGLPMTVYSEMSELDLEYLVREKIRGMRQAFADAHLPDGLQLHRKHVVPVDPSHIGLSEANVAETVKWLRSPDGPTGIVESAYRMPYVMAAARAAGLTLGKDLDVVGVGDPTAAHQGMYPVVSERFDVIAREVAAMVAVEDENFDQLGRQVVVPPVLVPQWQPGLSPEGIPVA